MYTAAVNIPSVMELCILLEAKSDMVVLKGISQAYRPPDGAQDDILPVYFEGVTTHRAVTH